MKIRPYLLLIVILSSIYLIRLYYYSIVTPLSTIGTVVVGRIGKIETINRSLDEITVGRICVRVVHDNTYAIGDLVRLTGSTNRQVTEENMDQYCLVNRSLEVVQAFYRVPNLNKILLYQNYLLLGQAAILRSYLGSVMQAILPDNTGKVLMGMVLGQKQQLPCTLYQNFQNSGLVHLLVASGGNIAIVTSVTLSISFVFLNRKKSLLLAFLLMGIYLLLAGFEPPLIRASIMVSLVWLAQIFGRKTSSVWVLWLTCMLMLMIDPLLIHAISFQLSVAATFGIVLFAKKIDQIVTIIIEKYHLSWLAVIAAGIGQSLGAQIMVTPLLLHHFAKTNILAILANLVVSPLVAPIMYLGLAMIISSYLLLPVAQWLGWLTKPLISLLIAVADFTSLLSFGVIQIKISMWFVLTYWIAVTSIFLLIERRFKK